MNLLLNLALLAASGWLCWQAGLVLYNLARYRRWTRCGHLHYDLVDVPREICAGVHTYQVQCTDCGVRIGSVTYPWATYQGETPCTDD